MPERDKLIIHRRGLLGIFATGGVAVATAAVRSTAHASPAAESRTDKAKARYHVTDDIKAYYRVNRYPARKE